MNRSIDQRTQIESFSGLSIQVKSPRIDRWLFPGYKNKPINPQLCNDIFQQLCEAAGMKDNEKRLSFHCCRMWFSAQLRNKVSDDLIDLCTGHNVRFGGAYLGDLQKTREVMLEAGVIDLLRLQQVRMKNERDMEIQSLKNQVEKLQGQVQMMMQGIEARDKQHFERKYPGLKAMDKTEQK